MMNQLIASAVCLMVVCSAKVRAEERDPAAPQKTSEPWSITVSRLDPEGRVLNITKTPVYQYTGGAFFGNLSLSIGMDSTLPWLIRFDGDPENKMLMFGITFPAFRTGEVPPYGFEGAQPWQGPGRYLVCETDREKVVAEIGPDAMAGRYAQEFVSPSRIELVRKDKNGVVTARAVISFIQDEEDFAELSLPVGRIQSGWEKATGFQHFNFSKEEDQGRNHTPLKVRIYDKSQKDSRMAHDIWMPFPDGKGTLVYDRDGEVVEVFIHRKEDLRK